MPLHPENTKRILLSMAASVALVQSQNEAPMTIVDGRLEGVRFVKARMSGGPIEPELIVLHDTAGWLKKFNTVGWFKSPKRGKSYVHVSAHFVVERDGTITQMVPTNRKAYHAGRSKYCGRVGCNSFSIGIEIVNPGKLDSKGRSWFGQAAHASEIEERKTKEHGTGYWLRYTDEQIKSVKRIARALVEEYPNCNEITTHWEISPGRKIDPNPLFPLDQVRDAVLSPDIEDDEPELDEAPVLVHEGETPKQPILEAADGKNMLASKTGNSAVGITSGGLLLTITTMLGQASTATNLAVGVAIIGFAILIWLERRKK